jgi:hypothetical protein
MKLAKFDKLIPLEIASNIPTCPLTYMSILLMARCTDPAPVNLQA